MAEGLCPEWVFSNTSNTHMSKNKEWFTEYTPINTYLGDIYGVMEKLPVIGIGTVTLLTKRSPNVRGAKSYDTLVLKNVLHAPSAICNVIGSPIFDDYDITLGGQLEGISGSITDKKGKGVAYFDARHRPFYQVRLVGPPVGPRVGPRVLGDGQLRLINCNWPDSERKRWEATLRTNHIEAPFTAEEKAWLADNGGEFHFLRNHGLNIYKEEDRAEGRSILRQIMLHEEDDPEHDSEEDDEDLEGHMADYHFTSSELEFIESRWGNSMNFLYSFGLKFYDNDDCKEGKMIAQGLMANEP
ncbi:hypothetical protein FQN57_006937 [Myotisia sp. PD_48]|nr:hypothetical protein FQN57_006937 [Myotisia sp. PD_48]